MLKKLSCTLLCSLVLTTTTPTYAAIPVIDGQNIMQQLKTYTETVNVVKNTAEQINLQLKELMSLPSDILQNYKKQLDNSVDEVASILQSSNILVDPQKWDEFWRKTFPKITGDDYPQTIWSERSIDDTIREAMSMKNQQDVQSYHDLMRELDASKARLADLLEQNKYVEGSKQAMQIANEIAAEKAHMESINTALQAITNQNQVMQQQAQITKEQNHQIVVKATQKAEEEALSRMDREVIKTVPIIDNPWKDYAHADW